MISATWWGPNALHSSMDRFKERGSGSAAIDDDAGNYIGQLCIGREDRTRRAYLASMVVNSRHTKNAKHSPMASPQCCLTGRPRFKSNVKPVAKNVATRTVFVRFIGANGA